MSTSRRTVTTCVEKVTTAAAIAQTVHSWEIGLNPSRPRLRVATSTKTNAPIPASADPATTTQRSRHSALGDLLDTGGDGIGLVLAYRIAVAADPSR